MSLLFPSSKLLLLMMEWWRSRSDLGDVEWGVLRAQVESQGRVEQVKRESGSLMRDWRSLEKNNKGVSEYVEERRNGLKG